MWVFIHKGSMIIKLKLSVELKPEAQCQRQVCRSYRAQAMHLQAPAGDPEASSCHPPQQGVNRDQRAVPEAAKDPSGVDPRDQTHLGVSIDTEPQRCQK